MLSMTSPGLAIGHDFKPQRELAAWRQRLAGKSGPPVSLACFDASSGRNVRLIGISARAKKAIWVEPGGPKTALRMSPQQTVKAVEPVGLSSQSMSRPPIIAPFVLKRSSP
jgi:hypothetical protein